MTSDHGRRGGPSPEDSGERGAEIRPEGAARRLRLALRRAAASNGHAGTVGGPVSVPAWVGLDEAQTLSDRDQTASDRDQTASDRDQTASDRADAVSAEDQERSDRSFEDGGDAAGHELETRARKRAASRREVESQERDDIALQRELSSAERDEAAERRDLLAAAGDDLERERGRPAGLAFRDALGRGSSHFRAEADRAKAAQDRENAALDREQAAHDRETAAFLRAAAAHDRAETARERTLAGIDELTGASLRGVGMRDVDREIERSRRTGSPLVLAFVDVNNLKAVNDTEGHIAGDALLRDVAETFRAKLRPYDVIVRFGGDEFVCALANTELGVARLRLDDIVAALEARGVSAPFSFGLAELEPEDDLKRLVERADGALLETRRLAGRLGRVRGPGPEAA